MENIKKDQQVQFELSGDTITAFVELVTEDRISLTAKISKTDTKLTISKSNFITKVNSGQIKLI